MEEQEADINYNTTIDIEKVDNDNYIINRCRKKFNIVYNDTHQLTLKLYKELVVLVRETKNWIHHEDSPCGFIVYVYVQHNGESYKVKFNQIDSMIKSFIPPDNLIRTKFNMPKGSLSPNRNKFYDYDVKKIKR